MTMPAFDFGYLTLFTNDLERTRAFYEAIGIEFSRHEKDGVVSYSTTLRNGVYLTFKLGEPSNCELHFGVQAYGGVAQKLKALGYKESREHRANPRGTYTYYDPDGRQVGLDEFG